MSAKKRTNQKKDQAAKDIIAERLRACRVLCDLSQREVSDALGIDRSTYTYYETGGTMADAFKLLTCSKIFGVPLETLLGVGDCPNTCKLRPRKRKTSELDTIGRLSSLEKSLITLLRISDYKPDPEKLEDLLDRLNTDLHVQESETEKEDASDSIDGISMGGEETL